MSKTEMGVPTYHAFTCKRKEREEPFQESSWMQKKQRKRKWTNRDADSELRQKEPNVNTDGGQRRAGLLYVNLTADSSSFTIRHLGDWMMSSILLNALMSHFFISYLKKMQHVKRHMRKDFMVTIAENRENSHAFLIEQLHIHLQFSICSIKYYYSTIITYCNKTYFDTVIFFLSTGDR